MRISDGSSDVGSADLEVEREREADRQIGVDLDQAVIAALIIIIAAPALVGHEFEAEAFAFGHRNMRHAPPAAARDRGVEGFLQPVLRDSETLEIGLDAGPERALARHQLFDLRSEEHTSELQSLMRT